MSKKLLSNKSNNNFYLPGEEIDIRREDIFVNWDNKNRNGYTAKGRILFGIFCCSLAYLLVAFRLFGTCIVPNMHETGEETETSQSRKNIHRADIVDRNGNIVATTLPTKDLDANVKNILSPRETAQKLVEIFPELKFDDVYKKLIKRKGTFTIQRHLTPHQQSLIMALGNPGLEFRSGEKRVYPHKNLLAHIIGTTDIDNNGTSGIEMGINDRIVQSDIPLKLSIDLGIQDTVRTILAKNVQKFNALSATAILLDANNGEIVAMVSLPDYDPNNITNKDTNARLNTATSRIYEPGSVLKVFNTAMALESGKVKINEKFDTAKPLIVNHRPITEYHGQNRPLTVEEVLVYSSNVGSARMALQAGFREQYNFLKKIKFLERLETEVVETARPLIPSESTWRKSEATVATIGYGYGVAVSPLHIVSAYASVINGGIYHNPTFIHREKQDEGYRVLADNTSKQMRKLLRAVVTDGSGRRADVTGYEVGGKTGTAKKRDDQGSYNAKKLRTTFISGFPISNPQYALLVMMDEPKGTAETFWRNDAGWNSVPAASEIIAAVAPQLNIPANYDLEEKRNNKIIEASFER